MSETSSENWPQALGALLRGHGLRITPARVAVLRQLQLGRRPLSHAEVVAALADRGWNRATLYRNLVDLVDAGLARKTQLGDRVWRFEAVPSAHSSRTHPHFVCSACGKVFCLPEAAVQVVDPGDAPRAVRENEIEVQVRGVCDGCRGAGEKAS